MSSARSGRIVDYGVKSGLWAIGIIAIILLVYKANKHVDYQKNGGLTVVDLCLPRDFKKYCLPRGDGSYVVQMKDKDRPTGIVAIPVNHDFYLDWENVQVPATVINRSGKKIVFDHKTETKMGESADNLALRFQGEGSVTIHLVERKT